MGRTRSTMILPLFLLFATAFAQETPLEQLIREAIYQANKATAESHHNVMETSGFKYDGVVNLEVDKITTSDFATVALKGTPDVKQVENKEGTSYYFDLGVGLEVLKLEFDYKFSFSFLSSSGAVILKNSGNAIKTRGVVNTFNGKTKPCNSVLQAVEIDSLGTIDVEFGQSGIFSWIFNRLIKFAYGIGESYVRSTINQMIVDKVQTTEFQSLFSKAACSPFDF